MNDNNNERIFIDKEEIPKLEKDEKKAKYGKQIFHMVGVIVGGIVVSGINYSYGHPMAAIAIAVATLDFLRADIFEIIRISKANKLSENNETDDNKINKR